MPVVQHPQFPKIIREVPTSEKAKEWTASGWVLVKKEDEDKVRAQADQPLT